ncbi:ABC transporter ATP-binding protein [bacterium (candidate division B38) B3_B38]|nr:MAG: ABC transporter ATP-binding protein [bacterium (candidate division B38) B3_B38]
MKVIETFKLSKTFKSLFRKRRVDALQQVNLEVEKGHIFGLIGPNGAGKTTLVKILLGITYPTLGSANIFGLPISDYHCRQRVGYLPEDHRYPPYLTAEGVLHYFGKLSEIPLEDRRHRIEELLPLVKLQEWRKVKIKKYSKGMMQRLGIAQALINNPDLLILDEPTAGVDPIGRREVRDLLLELRGRGKTIFLNSHFLSEVEMICDHIAILHEGRVIRSGPLEELTRAPHEYELRVSHLPPAVEEEIKGKVVSYSRDNEKLRLCTESTATLNSVIDLLREHKVELLSLGPKRTSLEELFIRVVREGEVVE